MPTEILAIGGGDGTSSDVVIAAGESLTVALKDVAGPIVAERDPNVSVGILLKDDDGQYFIVDRLTSDRPALLIQAAGTYQFKRMSGATVGVFSG